MKILLIDNYDSFTYNLYHYLQSLKCNVDVIRNDKITSKEIIRKNYKKIVISPGPGNPNQAGNCLKIVKDLSKNTHLGCLSWTSGYRASLWSKNYKCKKTYAWKNK